MQTATAVLPHRIAAWQPADDCSNHERPSATRRELSEVRSLRPECVGASPGLFHVAATVRYRWTSNGDSSEPRVVRGGQDTFLSAPHRRVASSPVQKNCCYPTGPWQKSGRLNACHTLARNLLSHERRGGGFACACRSDRGAALQSNQLPNVRPPVFEQTADD